MDVTCGRCRRSYFVPDDLAQGRTFRAKCSQCGHTFPVEVRPGAEGRAAPSAADTMPSTSASAIPGLAEALEDADLGWLDEAAKKADGAAAEDAYILLTVRRARRGSALALVAGAAVVAVAIAALALWMTGRYRLPQLVARTRGAATAAGTIATIDDVAGLAPSHGPEPPSQPPSRGPAAPAPVSRTRPPRLASGDRRLLDLLSRKQDSAPVGFDGEEGEASARSALDPVAAEKVIAANRRAFDDCVSRALRLNPELKLARRATMVVTVQPDGRVVKAAIAEEQVNRSDLGACLSDAARRMVFPSFDGDPIDIAMPLSLSVVF